MACVQQNLPESVQQALYAALKHPITVVYVGPVGIGCRGFPERGTPESIIGRTEGLDSLLLTYLTLDS